MSPKPVALEDVYLERFESKCDACEHREVKCKFSGAFVDDIKFKVSRYFKLVVPSPVDIPCPVFLELKRSFDEELRQVPAALEQARRKAELYPEAEEVTIELTGLDPAQWDKTALRPVEVRMKIYLQGKLVESGLEESVLATVILGVREDPYVTELIPMRVKDTKPSGMVQITGTTKVNVEGLPSSSFSLEPPIV